MQPGSNIANTTASSDQPRKRVRVRSKHRHFSTYNQFGIGRKDLIIGWIILIVLGAALVWAVYSYCIRDSGMGSEPGPVAVPDGSGGDSTRF